MAAGGLNAARGTFSPYAALGGLWGIPMPLTYKGDRTAAVAEIMSALIETKMIYPAGDTAEERATDMGRAFKALYAAVAAAEHGD